MARQIPDRLAIVFQPDEYDAWSNLYQRRLYLPPGVMTAGGVAAIGLTGNLTDDGPIGSYLEEQKAVLVMKGPEVARMNKLTEVAYSNLDLAVSNNFRVLRRVRERDDVEYPWSFPLAVAISLGNADFEKYLFDPRPSVRPTVIGGFADYVADAIGSTFRREESLRYRMFTTQYPFNSYASFVAAMNRFAGMVVGSVLDKLKKKPDDTILFGWGDFKTTRSGKVFPSFQRNIGGGVKYTVTLGDLRRGYQKMLAGIPGEYWGLLGSAITESLKTFETEREWFANPTFDARARGYSVTLNIPAGSVLFTLNRSLGSDRNHIAHLAANGTWVVNVENSDIMSWFNKKGPVPQVLTAIHEFMAGEAGYEYLRNLVGRFDGTIHFPADYWIVHREA